MKKGWGKLIPFLSFFYVWKIFAKYCIHIFVPHDLNFCHEFKCYLQKVLVCVWVPKVSVKLCTFKHTFHPHVQSHSFRIHTQMNTHTNEHTQMNTHKWTHTNAHTLIASTNLRHTHECNHTFHTHTHTHTHMNVFAHFSHTVRHSHILGTCTHTHTHTFIKMLSYYCHMLFEHSNSSSLSLTHAHSLTHIQPITIFIWTHTRTHAPPPHTHAQTLSHI